MNFMGLLERRKATSVAPKEPLPLAAALEKLEISPFTRSTVDDYKNKKLTETWETRMIALRCEGWRQLPAGYAHGYMPQIRRDLGPQWTDDDLYFYAQHYNSYPKCFAMGWHRFAVTPAMLSVMGDLPMPEHIKRKAEQIGKEVPGVVMEADVLQSDSAVFDPFLVVRLGNEEYYVEVWDEKDFDL